MVTGTGSKTSMCCRMALATLEGRGTSRTLRPLGSPKHSFVRTSPDAVQRQRTEVRDDVPTDPLLDAFESGRVAALGGPPVGRDVVLEGDGSVARINELAPAGVGPGLGEPGLGILECVEGSSLTAGMPLTR